MQEMTIAEAQLWEHCEEEADRRTQENRTAMVKKVCSDRELFGKAFYDFFGEMSEKAVMSLAGLIFDERQYELGDERVNRPDRTALAMFIHDVADVHAQWEAERVSAEQVFQAKQTRE